MIRIQSENLKEYLQDKLYNYYVLTGGDPLLVQECTDAIRYRASQLDFNEYINIKVDAQTNWDRIFMYFRSPGLFSTRIVLNLSFPECGMSNSMVKYLQKLGKIYTDNALVILNIAKLTKIQEKSAWFQALSKLCILISCYAPDKEHLLNWTKSRAGGIGIVINNDAAQLLCHYYEGNLIALMQSLYRLSLVFPGETISLENISEVASNSSIFSPFHWIDALLSGDGSRALHILNQLKVEGSEIVILIRVLQRNLIILLDIIYNRGKEPVKKIMERRKIWKHRQSVFTRVAHRIDLTGLSKAFHLLTEIEISIKKENDLSVWSKLECLSLLMCYYPAYSNLYDI